MVSVVGERPNIIKIAPLLVEMRKNKVDSVLVHTGQHSVYEMSRIFFRQLAIPSPDYSLQVGSRSEIQQLAKIMERLESVMLEEQPDLVLVVGDVTSTLAGALVSAKLCIPLAHVEAGLRSFDKHMPEEINRILTDHLSDFLFASEPQAVQNLLCEGIPKQKIFHVGDVMIDALIRTKIQSSRSQILKKLQLRKGEYGVVTLHRAENVDHKEVFSEILEALVEIQNRIQLIWPMHPRTKKMTSRLQLTHFLKESKKLKIIQPLGYLDMAELLKQSRIVFTDSGGIQEEATVLNVPCVTLRERTERPITVQVGTNRVVGTKKARILKESIKVLKGKIKKGRIPPYWDGKTSRRIVAILIDGIKHIESR